MKIKNTELTVPYYQVYHGKSKYCLKGRLVMGYSRRMFIFSFCYLNGLSILQLIRIEPQIGHTLLEIIFLILTDIFMIKTVFNDPGIIPRINNQYQKVS